MMNLTLDLSFLNLPYNPIHPKNPINVAVFKEEVPKNRENRVFRVVCDNKKDGVSQPTIELHTAKNGQQYKVRLQLGRYSNAGNKSSPVAVIDEKKEFYRPAIIIGQTMGKCKDCKTVGKSLPCKCGSNKIEWIKQKVSL